MDKTKNVDNPFLWNCKNAHDQNSDHKWYVKDDSPCEVDQVSLGLIRNNFERIISKMRMDNIHSLA